MKLVTDEEFRARVSMPAAIDAVEKCVRARAEERFVSPPRLSVRNDVGALTFTIGGDEMEGHFGFRVYPHNRRALKNSQATLVFDAATGTLEGIVTGDYIGELRTGAIGGVALKHLSRPDATRVGLIGTGRQARTQLLAAHAVRKLTSVKVYSRDEKRRTAFAEELGQATGLSIEPAASPAEAFAGADIAITATSSRAAVFALEDLPPGCHLQIVGPKFNIPCELPDGCLDQDCFIVTDSMEQLDDAAYGDFFKNTPYSDGIVDLSELVGGQRGVPDRKRSVFISVGLAGTEPAVAALAL